MNEWEFAGEIKSWWDAEFDRNPLWRVDRCAIERQLEGSSRRSDLTVIAEGREIAKGELRLPDHAQASPWHPDNLSNAINKATTAGARWAFTSDACELLLIDTQLSGPPQSRVVQTFDLVTFESRNELESSAFLDNVERAWTSCLYELMPIVLGRVPPTGMAPDEAFINSLRALLMWPVASIRQALSERRERDVLFERQLVVWMVDEQGWAHHASRWEEELLRTARLTAYVFMTRLLFYEALRQSQPSLNRLSLPDVDASMARTLLSAYFNDARVRSQDYETIFGWDQVCEYALIADGTVSGWRRVLEQLVVIDLGSISYDIIGRLFERLIDPDERYRWGQYYTAPNVVDLMLSFGLPSGAGRVMDPACGGGTFLVRGYARKHVAEPQKAHEDLLAEIFGVDSSAFAATLATINLAVRQLQFADNYPRIAPRSFFQVSPGGNFVHIPSPAAVALSGDATDVAVSVIDLDAIVCNPPYVRVQHLSPETRQEAASVLGRTFGHGPTPSTIHGLSNYHVYFWLHAAQFLRRTGRMVFITSGEWMDSDYGADLQDWLLSNFKLHAFIESLAEPWFSEARVGTVVTVAQLCEDPDERANNPVRFVLLRKTLAELYGSTSDDVDQMNRVDSFRDRLLSLEVGTGESDDFDWSVVLQGELTSLGTVASDA